MEGRTGGSEVRGGLETLEAALHEYFGALNEQSTGQGLLKVEIPDKPEALVLLEQMEFMNLPLITGSVISQPHLFMQELAVVRETRTLWEMFKQNNTEE